METVATKAKPVHLLLLPFLFWTLGTLDAGAQTPDLIVMTEEFPPFAFTENGSLTGLSVEIVQAVERNLGVGYPITIYPWARAYTMVRTLPNTVLFSMAKSPERENLFQWVGPLVTDHMYFYQRKGARPKPKTLDEAKAETVLVTHDYPEQAFLEAHGFTNLSLTAQPSQSWHMLVTGHGDLVVSGEIPLGTILKENGISPDSVERTDVRLFSSDLYIAFSLSVPKNVVASWQEALDRLKSSGQFTKILHKYLTGP